MRLAETVIPYIPFNMLDYLRAFMPICVEGIQRESELATDPKIPQSSHELAAALLLASFYDPQLMGLWSGLRGSWRLQPCRILLTSSWALMDLYVIAHARSTTST
jgi:hypothetical protein